MKVSVTYPGPEVRCEIPREGIYYPALGLRLVPGVNQVESEIAAPLLAAGTVTQSAPSMRVNLIDTPSRRTRRTKEE